jgi:polyhydroxyalkanoate synthesis repressor PhaR
MSAARIIKKYPNRRLYDTEESRYITLTDIRNLILSDTDLVVVDKKSGDDITRVILLQVISEQEKNGSAILSETFLAQIIRNYGGVASHRLAEHLTQSLRQFIAQTQNISDENAPATYLQKSKNSLTSGP